MNYIERNPAKCFAMPSLIGRRLTVCNVVTQIDIEGLELATKTYEITKEQAKASLKYCSELMCKIDSEQFQFCDGCILRYIADGEEFNRENYVEVQPEDGVIFTFSKSGDLIFSGTIDELERDEKGKEIWITADVLLKKYFS